MLLKLFSILTHAFESNIYIGVPASFCWGILSILLSPCHLASIPLIVGFISQRQNVTTKKAFTFSAIFSLGIFVTITLTGIITGLAGKMLGDIGKTSDVIVSIVFFIVGLNLLGALEIPSIKNPAQKYQQKGFLAAFIMGLIFGAAIGPCTFAFMAPVLAVAFRSASTNFLYSLAVVLFFALGHCTIIVIAGTFAAALRNYFNWSRSSGVIETIKKICGILIILSGLYMILKK